ncbi:unnamed protein product [Protopolystoma xenopodis]|uniref:Uncharacterized protein n=1 Tax=Protopolystoma xenopodis TaxID=117903 RepID=A0A3S5CVX8_9PLAT|nr:unnamed protein product [Protopolystoma xenopodis]
MCSQLPHRPIASPPHHPTTPPPNASPGGCSGQLASPFDMSTDQVGLGELIQRRVPAVAVDLDSCYATPPANRQTSRHLLALLPTPNTSQASYSSPHPSTPLHTPPHRPTRIHILHHSPTLLHYTTLYWTTPKCCTILYYIMQFNTVQYNTRKHNAIQYYTIIYFINHTKLY